MVALDNLAFAQIGHATDDVVEQIELAALQTEPHVACQYIVADDDRIARLPTGIDRGSSAPHIRLVDNVVVNQRGNMNHLDQHTRQHGTFAEIAGRRACSRRKHHYRRPQTLAARREDVVQHLRQKTALPVGKVAAHEVVESAQFGLYRFANRIECRHKAIIYEQR